MRLEISERICDNCGKRTEARGIMLGGNVFGGWLSLNRDGDLIDKPKGPWDFCCLDCLVEFVKNGNKENWARDWREPETLSRRV